MRKRKAFTLIEVLVVISIIALLLAILVPSLNKVKELSRRIVCGNHLKTLTTASITYAAAYDGFYVPCGYRGVFYSMGSGPGDEYPAGYDGTSGEIGVSAKTFVPDGDTDGLLSVRWMFNTAFRKYVNMDDYAKDNEHMFNSPDEFLCPSDKVSNKEENALANVLTSYGYNITDWSTWDWGNIWTSRNAHKGHVGHRVDAIKHPAEKLHFTDGIDWWLDWNGANYELGWDKAGQASIKYYRTNLNPAVYGPVLYRHSEGAVIGFYDGHAQRMDKEEIFVKADYNANPKRAGMWTSTGRIPGQ